MKKQLVAFVLLLSTCHRVACQIITTVTELPSGPITFPFPIPTGTPTIIFIPTGTITFVFPGGHPTSWPPGASSSITDGDGDMPDPTPEPKQAAYNPAGVEKVKFGGDVRSNDDLELEDDFEADASDDNGDDGEESLSRDTDDAFVEQ
ncbi:hypothetical protein PspLS_09341 [Pyricularia sp. CBS 133598]|nr:hypothetical protein PspLS_09341 [Pyricularia sp. CBS 133598]